LYSQVKLDALDFFEEGVALTDADVATQQTVLLAGRLLKFLWAIGGFEGLRAHPLYVDQMHLPTRLLRMRYVLHVEL